MSDGCEYHGSLECECRPHSAASLRTEGVEAEGTMYAVYTDRGKLFATVSIEGVDPVEWAHDGVRVSVRLKGGG